MSKWHIRFSETCPFVAYEFMPVKPPCKFHFWYLEQLENNIIGGLCNIFLKTVVFQKFFSHLNWDKNFWKLNFWKIFHLQLYFFSPNMKLECLQLSFDIHIVHTSKKFRYFPSCSTKNWKFFLWDLLTFAPFYKKTTADWMFFKDSIGE